MEEIRAHGAKVLTVAADVTNVEDVRKVVDETAREFGRLDILGEIPLTVTRP